MMKNKVIQLVNELGYEEFLTQLIMYEKNMSRKKANKLFNDFMESDLASIFEIQYLIDGGF